MKDVHNKLSADLAAELIKQLEAPEVRELVERTKSAGEGDTGTFRVVITTENIDRYQEVIKLDGWELERYLANPVVLWGHDHSRLIGMATGIEITDGKMIATGKFAPTPDGQEKRALYDLGFLRATSVGFIEKEREGNLITKAELLEFSFVSVPANPYALSLAMEKELNVNELVTKGLMYVEKAGEEEVIEPEEEATVVEPAPELEERNFSTKQLTPVIDALKSAIVALEALGTKAVEPEGGEDDDAVVLPEEEEGAKKFLAMKTLFQSVDTTLGEVLAELRQADTRR